MDQHLNRLLHDLRSALSKAVCESPEVVAALRQMQDSGYLLYVMVDRRRDADSDDDAIELSVADRSEELERGAPRAEPVFRIDGEDLVFLRSIGIDPTRRSRKRRTR